MLATFASMALSMAVATSGCKEKASHAAIDSSTDAGGPRLVKFDPATLERLGVKVATPGAPGGELRIHVPGQLEYDLEQYAEIGTIVEGRVASVLARVGDPVKKGQRLAQILVPTIANAQAEYLSAQAASTQAMEHAEREEGLLKKELTTVHEAHLAQSEATQSAASLAAAAARLQALGVGIPKPGTVVQGAGTLTLTAPIDGVVVRRDAVLGRFLQPNEKAFVVANPASLWATVEVFEQDIVYFHMGAEVDIAIDAIHGKVVKGKVALIEPQIGAASRALRARIAVPNPDNELKPGLFVRASIKTPTQATEGKVLVPPAAVQPLGDEDVVFVERTPGIFEVRNVRVGKRTTQVAEVLEGLTGTERIAVEGTFLLRGEVTKQ